MGRPRKTKSGVKINPKTGKAETGRPPKINKDVLKQLESVFTIGGTDEEACLYADISMQTLYNYQKENPEFIDRKKLLKNKPLLKARKTVVENLHIIKHAKWYLERKNKKEFSLRYEVTGKDGERQEHSISIDDLSNIISKLPKDEQKKYYANLADLYDTLSSKSGYNKTGKPAKQKTKSVIRK